MRFNDETVRNPQYGRDLINGGLRRRRGASSRRRKPRRKRQPPKRPRRRTNAVPSARNMSTLKTTWIPVQRAPILRIKTTWETTAMTALPTMMISSGRYSTMRRSMPLRRMNTMPQLAGKILAGWRISHPTWANWLYMATVWQPLKEQGITIPNNERHRTKCVLIKKSPTSGAIEAFTPAAEELKELHNTVFQKDYSEEKLEALREATKCKIRSRMSPRYLST